MGFVNNVSSPRDEDKEGTSKGGIIPTTVVNQQQPLPNYYGTFQGVANYSLNPHGAPHVYYHQGGQPYHPLPVFVVAAEGRPVREHRLPCCGLGLGWFLFILGFFLGGVPWYIGAFILVCVQMDYREKPGLIACMVGSLVAAIAFTLGVIHPGLDKLSWSTNIPFNLQ